MARFFISLVFPFLESSAARRTLAVAETVPSPSIPRRLLEGMKTQPANPGSVLDVCLFNLIAASGSVARREK